QDDSTVQHVPSQIGGPYSGDLLFTKQLPYSRRLNELNGLLTPLELRKVLFIAVLQGICYTVTECLIYELHLHHLHSPLCVLFSHRLVDSVLFYGVYPVYYAILFAHLPSEALMFSDKVYPSNFSKVGTYKMTCTSCRNHRTNCMTVTLSY
ncbi:hypothetical protein AALO_G00093480, partial [Alosa alosa]